MSATPFYLQGSAYTEGHIFGWTVSDFSLMDAIESGIVKVPRTPVDDDAAHPLVTYLRLWDFIGTKVPKSGSADQHAVSAKLRQWYWCGVLGELYGGTTETPVQPRRRPGAGLGPRQRTARDGCRGVVPRAMQAGCEDWLKNQRLDLAAAYDLKIDIHHVFPKDWCAKHGIDANRRESIVNKTALAYDTNRIIGGRSPADYLEMVERRSGLDPATIDKLVATHRIEPATLRAADFNGYVAARTTALLDVIAEAMGKNPVRTQEAPDVDRPDTFADHDVVHV